MGKLTLKNAALKQQILKMENQLQHKEEMGEVLHVIDFDQLKIENQQYLEKIEERNNELLKLCGTPPHTLLCPALAPAALVKFSDTIMVS